MGGARERERRCSREPPFGHGGGGKTSAPKVLDLEHDGWVEKHGLFYKTAAKAAAAGAV